MSFRLFMTLLLIPQVTLAGVSPNAVPKQPKAVRPVLKNVELTKQGQLKLQIVDNGGVPIPHAQFVIRSGNLNTAWKADDSGRVLAAGISGGTCLFSIGNQQFACRVWQNGTAPPKSLTSIALVNEDPAVVRGNLSRKRQSAAGNCCNECERTQRLSSEAKYGLGILALGGTAAYFALSRDNASE